MDATTILRLRSEIDRLHSWEGLMSLLDEHYPAEIFIGARQDPGPRLVALLRENDRLRRGIDGNP